MPAEVTSGGAGPRAEVIAALRKVWDTLPRAHAVLADDDDRRVLTDLLLPLVKPTHTVAECESRLRALGFKIIPPGESPAAVVEAALTEKPAPTIAAKRTTTAAVATVPTSLSTQAGRLLVAYVAAGERGLTYDEAKVEAKITDVEGAWKRVSELRAAGLLKYLLNEHDEIEHREGRAGVIQQVIVITDYGKAVVATMEEA